MDKILKQIKKSRLSKEELYLYNLLDNSTKLITDNKELYYIDGYYTPSIMIDHSNKIITYYNLHAIIHFKFSQSMKESTKIAENFVSNYFNLNYKIQ